MSTSIIDEAVYQARLPDACLTGVGKVVPNANASVAGNDGLDDPLLVTPICYPPQAELGASGNGAAFSTTLPDVQIDLLDDQHASGWAEHDLR